MAHRITEECILCGLCEPVCPQGAVTAGPDRYRIDPRKCADTGRCVEVCPQECIIAPEAFQPINCPDEP